MSMRDGRPAPTPSLFRQLAEQALARSAGAPLVAGNRVELLFDAAANFAAWLDAIAQAEHCILVEMYLFADDDFGRQLRSALQDKARQGVRVYLLYDWLGSWREHYRGFFKPLLLAGAQVRVWQPPSFGKGFRLLGRDHRKLIVVDGHTAFIGGLCASSRWNDWRDTGLRLQGPLLDDAVTAFADSWLHAGDGALPPVATDRSSHGEVAARLIATTPATANLMRLDLLIAGFARRRLWLTDAYFMGTSTYLTALQQAARDGVDVRLLVPRSSDIGWIATVSRTLYRPLLSAGVRVFEWDGTMIHAKTAVADSRWARIGSTNLNVSSWLANRELDLAIEDEALARQMETRFLQDLDHATEIVLSGQHLRPALKHARGERRRLPVRQQAVVGAAAAARQALRIGDAVGAAVRGTRNVEQSEAASFLSIALTLLGLTLLVLLFPWLAALPLALLLGFAGVSVLLRAATLYRRRWQKKQHPVVPARPDKPPPDDDVKP
ncbi:phospholipase D-like domain-containing protein [Vogesella indigofera]|uniref:phospholipase D-like domain-containing protein n=1 Tax=Vogesella indigofera TaxID=45465 RepID=UPI00234FAC27|nr:phospholipase D-like domain-containing protein [Vogesella indigofera]MDC7700877.1 phospholipase D-like domain-containing protein [Vogesella indigofera]